jgi:hypothetical protein
MKIKVKIMSSGSSREAPLMTQGLAKT